MAETRMHSSRGEQDGGGSEAEACGGQHLTETFERSVAEGQHRLGRTWPQLLATGTVGGMDVSMGVLGLLVVEHTTDSPLLGALAFSIGFIALTLAGSELFTENFLVPVVAVAAHRATVKAVLRLWTGTLLTNLLGGWVLTGLVIAGLPEVRPTAVKLARHYIELPPSQALAAAVVGGVVITLMTWMERGTESVPGKLAAAISAAFLLAGATLNHAIVVSLLIFAALHAGAPFGYLDWLHTLGLAIAGNMVGGLGLVTVLRLVQVGGQRVGQVRAGAPVTDGRR
jgi:formate/nitrite transporter FocA (FNT family)